jgi:hypothetical protein
MRRVHECAASAELRRRRRGAGRPLQAVRSSAARRSHGEHGEVCEPSLLQLPRNGARQPADLEPKTTRFGTRFGPEGLDDAAHERGGLVGEVRGSSSTCADWSRMNPQFAHVSGNASVPRSTALPPTTCSSATRSSHPCQSSWPQNGHAIRASRLSKKSKMRFVASPICTPDGPNAADRSSRQGTGPTERTLCAGRHLASRASARRWLQAFGQSSGRRASATSVLHSRAELR